MATVMSLAATHSAELDATLAPSCSSSLHFSGGAIPYCDAVACLEQVPCLHAVHP